MRTLVGILTWLAIAIVLGIAVGTSNYLMLLAAAAILVLYVMFFHIEATIYAIIVLTLSLDWLSSYLHLLPRPAIWFPDLLSVVLLLRLGLDLATQKIVARNTFITYAVYAWLVIVVAGVIANSVAPLVVLAGCRNYFRFIPVLFAFSLYPFSDRFIKRTLHLLVLIAAVQIFFALPERFFYKGFSYTFIGDAVVGTLGRNASGILAVFQLLTFSVLMGLYKANYYSSRQVAIYGTLVLLPTFITEAKVVFYILPLLFLVNLVEFNRRTLLKNTLLALMGTAILVTGAWIYDSFYAESAKETIQQRLSSPQETFESLGFGKVKRYQIDVVGNQQGDLLRGSAITFMFQNIRKSPITTMLGVGIGNAHDSPFGTTVGYYHKKYPNLGITSVSAAAIGWEFGYAGLILFGVLLARLYLTRPHMDHGPFYNGVFYGAKGIVVITVICLVYNAFFILEPLSLFFWTYLGILSRGLAEEKVPGGT